MHYDRLPRFPFSQVFAALFSGHHAPSPALLSTARECFALLYGPGLSGGNSGKGAVSSSSAVYAGDMAAMPKFDAFVQFVVSATDACAAGMGAEQQGGAFFCKRRLCSACLPISCFLPRFFPSQKWCSDLALWKCLPILK